MKTMLLLFTALLLAPGSAHADVPAWANDPCVGLDCAATPAGVGQSSLLPEMTISSAIAYAQAARSLSSAMTEFVSVNARQYQEEAAQSVDSAVKDSVKSPLGAALTKSYAASDADTISVSIMLQRVEDPGVRVYAQEAVDASSGTLYVRLLLYRSPDAVPPAGFVPWPGRRIRLNSQDIRVGRHNEMTLWVQDEEAGLTWVEQWPMGGADLMQDGQVRSTFIFDRIHDRWMASTKGTPP
jgi:hypothetical protein